MSINMNEFSKDIFNITESTVYDVIEKFDDSQKIDKSLTYNFVKAFYIHSLKLYVNVKDKSLDFNEIYNCYREELKKYYKNNNILITDEFLNDLLESFDKSYQMIESLGFNDIENDYEFRHHIVNSFELLKMILESKSKVPIRQDFFENYISKFKRESEMIFEIYNNYIK